MLVFFLFAVGCRTVGSAPSGGPASATATALDTAAALALPKVVFAQARALAVDPAGRLYVADAGADVVVRLTPATPRDGAPGGFVAERLGGPGTEAGEFFEPSDVDATNGQVLLVADAGNGRVQRFSRFFRHLETLLVDTDPDAIRERPASPVYAADHEARRSLGRGRPVAVAATGADETLALDAEEGMVLRWDASRRAERLLGGLGQVGRLRQPTALAVGPGGLFFVGDDRAVYAFDRGGAFVRAVAEDLPAHVQALGVHGRRLWVVLPEGVRVYDAEGRLLRQLASPADAPLVDAAPAGDAVFFLTAWRLHRGAP